MGSGDGLAWRAPAQEGTCRGSRQAPRLVLTLCFLTTPEFGNPLKYLLDISF